MEQIFSAIPAILAQLGPDSGARESIVFAAWNRTAGDMLNKRTRALEYFEERLVVAVEDETWRRHLEELSPQMLLRLNRSLGDGTVRFIEFRVDARAKQRDDVGNVARAPASVPGPGLVNAAKAISDPDLRDRFLSAAAAYLAVQDGS